MEERTFIVAVYLADGRTVYRVKRSRQSMDVAILRTRRKVTKAYGIPAGDWQGYGTTATCYLMRSFLEKGGETFI